MSQELQYFGYKWQVDCEVEDESLLDQDFLNAMIDNMRRGIKHGRRANDWKNRDANGVVDRKHAIKRHLNRYDKTRDPKHLAAIACNSLIVWWHRMKEIREE